MSPHAPSLDDAVRAMLETHADTTLTEFHEPDLKQPAYPDAPVPS